MRGTPLTSDALASWQLLPVANRVQFPLLVGYITVLGNSLVFEKLFGTTRSEPLATGPPVCPCSSWDPLV